MLLSKNPEFWSTTNVERIKGGLVPEVDEKFIEFFPQYKDCLGSKLVQHHIGGGLQAVAVPQNLHEGFGGMHNIEKEFRIRNNDYLTYIAEVLFEVKEGYK